MDQQNPFKWRHYEADIILLCVRWYLRYSLSYRDLEEMMQERGLHVDHTTIYRSVQCSAPELEKRCRPHLNTTNDSWRVDETDVKVKKVWMYPLLRCGFAGKHSGISAQSHTRCPGCQTLLRESAGCASDHHPSGDQR